MNTKRSTRQQHHHGRNHRHDRPDTGPCHVDRDEYERAHPEKIGPERRGRHDVLNRNDDHCNRNEDADRNPVSAEAGIAQEQQCEHRTAEQIHGARECLLCENTKHTKR